MKHIWLVLSLFMMIGCSKPDAGIVDSGTLDTPETESTENSDSDSEQKQDEEEEEEEEEENLIEINELSGWYIIGEEYYNICDRLPGASGPWYLELYVYVDEDTCQFYCHIDVLEGVVNIEPDYYIRITREEPWYLYYQDQTINTNFWEAGGTYNVISGSDDSISFELDSKRKGLFIRSSNTELHSLFENTEYDMAPEEVVPFLFEQANY